MDAVSQSILRGYLDNVQIQLQTVQYTKVSPTWGTTVNLPEVTRLYFIREGRGWIAVRNQKFFPHSGQLLLLPAGQSISFDTEAHQPFGKYWCHFTANVGEVNLFQLITLPYCIEVHDPETLDQDFRHLIDCYQHPTLTSPLKIKAMLLNILSLYLEQADAEDGTIFPRSTPDTRRIDRILRYIEEHLTERIRIDDLAEVAHFHPQYVGAYFRSMLGLSPIMYINHKRVEVAKQLLIREDLSIGEVAEQLGLEAYYFSRLFKQYTGLSPKTYRLALTSVPPQSEE